VRRLQSGLDLGDAFGRSWVSAHEGRWHKSGERGEDEERYWFHDLAKYEHERAIAEIINDSAGLGKKEKSIDRICRTRSNGRSPNEKLMKKLLTLTATALFALTALSFAASDKDTITEAEKSAWQSIKDKKFDAFQKMLATDFRGVYASGINKADKEVADVRTLDFKSFTLGEMDVVFIDKGCAMVTYQVTIEGTEGGKDISGKAYAASFWKKEGNDWRIAFHTDMKAE
jgi:hypothetical protein